MANVQHIMCDFCSKSQPISQSHGWLVKSSVFRMRHGSKASATKVLDHKDYCSQDCLIADLRSMLNGKSNG